MVDVVEMVKSDGKFEPVPADAVGPNEAPRLTSAEMSRLAVEAQRQAEENHAAYARTQREMNEWAVRYGQ